MHDWLIQILHLSDLNQAAFTKKKTPLGIDFFNK